MNINPEFRRNLWLEITPARLAGMPFVLGILLLLAFLADNQQFGEGVASTALGLFGLLTLVWGTRQSAESIVAEIREHTWDSQRMSVVGPWAMTWGKLLGSTIYPWYGAVLCLLVYFGATPTLSLAPLATLVLLVGCGLLAQALGMLSSLQALRKNRRYTRFQTTTYLVVGMGAALLVFGNALSSPDRLIWYGLQWSSSRFLIGSLVVFLGWAVLGIYRLVRDELQLRSLPWAWGAFVLFLMAYLAGFAEYGGHGIEQRLISAFFVALALAYGAAFSEPKGPVLFRHLLQLAAQRRWRRLGELLPLWLVTLPFVLAAAAALLMVELTAAPQHVAGAGSLGTVAMALFLLRDIGIMLFLHLGKIPKRADMLTVLVLTLLYGVFPAILAILDLDGWLALLWPIAGQASVVVFVSGAFQVSVVFGLLLQRWGKISREY